MTNEQQKAVEAFPTTEDLTQAYHAAKDALEQAQRERDEAIKQSDALRFEIRTINSTYSKQRDELQAKLLAEQAAGAEMRSLLERYGAMGPTQTEILNALSSTHGTSFLKERERHLEIIKGLFDLIERKILVRNTDGDAAPDWAIKQVKLVTTLKIAHECIAREALKETK